MTRHHPSTVASPGTATPWGSGPHPVSANQLTAFGYDVGDVIQLVGRLGKIRLNLESSHELFDRLDYIRVNGGDLIYTDDGPKLDEDNEALFLIWRGQQS